MKKRNLLRLCFLTVLFTSYCYEFSLAQTIKFDMGPEYKLKKRTNVPDRFIHGDQTGLYLLWSNLNMGSIWAHAYSFGAAKIKATAFVQKYDNKLNQVFDKEFITNMKDLNFEDLIWSGDKFIMFTSKFDKPSNTNTAYANYVDAKGNVDSKSITVMKLALDVKHGTGGFDFCVSDDSTKFLVYGSPPYEKKENRKFTFAVYSTGLIKQWEKVVTLPYPENMLEIEDYTVSDKGNVFILVKKYDEDKAGGLFSHKDVKKTDAGKVANYKYEILAYTDNGESFKEYTLDLKGKFVVDPTFKVDPKGNLAVAGFYSDVFYGSEKGIFYMTIDGETKGVKTSNMKEFTKDMIEAMGKDRMESKKKGKDQGLRDFVFSKFLLRDDGGAVILAENHYVIETTYFDKYGSHTTYHYYYNDIIAINVNPKGEIQWFSRVPKKQVANADMGYLSFAAMVAGDKIYLVYNDNKKNAEDNGSKTKYFNYKDGVAVIVTIDANGKMTKKDLFGLKDNKTILYPKLCIQTTSNKMAAYMQKGKNYRIGSITVQ